MPTGELEKLQIIAFRNADYSDSPDEQEKFDARINPESYTLDYKVEYQDGQGQGTSASQQRFTVKKPEEFAFELLFDSTGIAYPAESDTVQDEIDTLRDLLLKYEGDIHEPKHFQVVWGSLLFKGRCTGLNISLKLFNADGQPIRAVCKVTLKGSVEDNMRTAEERRESPDLTRYWLIKDGDTLPLICYKTYGDSTFYAEVARVNQLSNMRKLEPGDTLILPPLSRKSSTS